MNIVERDDDGNVIIQVKTKAFAHRDGNTFDGHGYSFNAVKNTTTMGMFTVHNDCEFSGIEIINGAMGDTVHLRVMHPTDDNIVIDQFGTDWNMKNETMLKVLNYASFIPDTYRICVPYTNNDSVDRTIYVNLDLHKKIV